MLLSFYIFALLLHGTNAQIFKNFYNNHLQCILKYTPETDVSDLEPQRTHCFNKYCTAIIWLDPSEIDKVQKRPGILKILKDEYVHSDEYWHLD